MEVFVGIGRNWRHGIRVRNTTGQRQATPTMPPQLKPDEKVTNFKQLRGIHRYGIWGMIHEDPDRQRLLHRLGLHWVLARYVIGSAKGYTLSDKPK